MAARLGAGGGGLGVGPFFFLGDFGETAPALPTAPGAGAGAGDSGAAAGSSLPPMAPEAVHSVWKIGSRERPLARLPESSDPLPLFAPASSPPSTMPRGGVHGGDSGVAAPVWMAAATAARGAPSGTSERDSVTGDFGDGGGLPGPAPPAASPGDAGCGGRNGATRGERGEPGGTVTVSLAPPAPDGDDATGAAPR